MAAKNKKGNGQMGIHEYDRDPRKVLLKKKKRIRLKKQVKVVLIVLIVIFVLFFLFSRMSKVNSFSFKGNSQVDSAYLESKLTKYRSKMYFLLNDSDVEKTLEKQPLVAKASVTHDLLGHVNVQISEAHPVAYAVIGKKTYILDSAKHVFETNSAIHVASIQQYPKLEKFTSVKILKAFLKEYLKLPDVIRSSVSDVVYDKTKTEDKQVRFIMDNGKQIVVRYNEMAKALATDKFNYQAYVSAYKDYCTFTIRNNRIVYMKKC